MDQLILKMSPQIDTRLVVLDVSGVYAQIYDEIYCSNEDVVRYIADYDLEKTGFYYVEISI